MPDYTGYYVAGAFLAGAALTVAYNQRVTSLEHVKSQDASKQHHLLARLSKINDLDTLKKTLAELDGSWNKGERPADIKEGIEGCIGNTPLIRIKSLSEYTGCDILVKAEFLNGAGNSPKDRVALSIIEMAEEKGLLVPNSGDTIYEGTVGSTGISLAAICRARGYKAHICMPNDMAVEKSDILLKLGAEVERVKPAPIVDQKQFVNLARARAAEHTASDKPGRGLFADQFETEANWRAHFAGTGPEIYEQTGGSLDAFVSGAGTGGTISGVALFLKSRLPDVKIVLADPPGSGLFNRVKYGVMFDPKEREGTRRRHQVDTIVEGIGINRVTHNFDVGRELIDDAIRVSDDQATSMARWLVEHDGIFVGSSSAVNCVAATKLAKQLGPGHRIVTLLCDSGARHLSKFWAQTEPVGGADNDVSLEQILST
ncbi:tryptophan synthase beta subunit-like PLP-dependent enzyme [Boeremia exigua]|uniref:tryptophan synthase beta subunit-like PLP-dependent enzyme n=1 Tax=Boeremia exigua TaxID=749465 RepID=UPI001E8EAD0D|nr:tryptophan synthase beta subunit-like PLP-dependent enzyme [Boeremia exigua]KAH6637996.1 tryptophan synthase beta subunit-like PLP-dependent enzyme [Boeremia exigua]